MPSIAQIINNHFSTCTETATNEFDLRVDDLSNFIDSAEKGDAVNYANATVLHHAKGNNATMHHAKEDSFILTPEEIACRTSKWGLVLD